MQTNDRNLTDLMASVHSAKAQLPDFQRGWVWDDDRIKALIASITSNYPVGAAMFLMNLSTREAEFKNKMFPLNIILDFVECQKWQNEYYAFHEYDSTVIQEFTKFNNEIVMVTYQ